MQLKSLSIYILYDYSIQRVRNASLLVSVYKKFQSHVYKNIKNNNKRPILKQNTNSLYLYISWSLYKSVSYTVHQLLFATTLYHGLIGINQLETFFLRLGFSHTGVVFKPISKGQVHGKKYSHLRLQGSENLKSEILENLSQANKSCSTVACIILHNTCLTAWYAIAGTINSGIAHNSDVYIYIYIIISKLHVHPSSYSIAHIHKIV